MKLLDLAKNINEAVERAGDSADSVDIFVSFKNSEYEIRSISQFSVVTETYIEIGECVYREGL